MHASNALVGLDNGRVRSTTDRKLWTIGQPWVQTSHPIPSVIVIGLIGVGLSGLSVDTGGLEQFGY